MPLWGIALTLVGTLAVFAAVHYIAKNKRPVKRALISMCVGIVLMLVINLTARWTGVFIPVSLLSLLTAVIGGVPGITLILFLNLFF